MARGLHVSSTPTGKGSRLVVQRLPLGSHSLTFGVHQCTLLWLGEPLLNIRQIYTVPKDELIRLSPHAHDQTPSFSLSKETIWLHFGIHLDLP